MKHIADIIAPVIVHIINRIFESGIFLDCLKIARVCPIYKGGDKHLMTNFRPISVLPVLSKVLESALNVRLQTFFSKYNVISDMQYGFQKKINLAKQLFLISNIK